ncbi:MAG: YHS domain-containing (seleno)protein [Gemmatimonadales bacterium]
MKPTLLAITLLLGMVAPAAAQNKVLVNIDKTGLALQGFDPVSYFTPTGPVRGRQDLTASHLGATYRFASAENRDRFVADPATYAPQFGGYCGYGASRDYLAPVDPEAFTLMDGRLILQNSKRVLQLWLKDPTGRLALADRNWSGLLEREGKTAP